MTMREGAHAIDAPYGPRRMAYTEWGDAANPRVALCVHGMTRNGRDFDVLAAALAPTHRVLCVDVAGRGKSDWLDDKAGYMVGTYVRDLAGLLGQLGVTAVDWIGTSMGGIIGMTVAASPEPALRPLVRRLVLNDIGPFLPGRGMMRIAEFVGRAPGFADLAAAERYQREINAPWGALSEAQWAHLARHAVRADAAGGYRIHYDPALGEALRQGPIPDLDIWTLWDEIRCPVFVLRGGESDILLPETAAEMRVRGPGAEVFEVPGVGHAPALMDQAQIGAIRRWLETPLPAS